ncbi:hypothetical protein B5X24_HaOG208299 [Helicoverpa armigera]|nr:hypothetical protein B5X24_HaOG208299 [Helicoverpa armigera]
MYLERLTTSVLSDSSPQLAQWGSSIDALMQRLQRDSWERGEAPCLQSTLTLLHNVKNHTLWASWIWNSNTVATGNLFGSLTNFGNFDQCLKPPWLRTHPHFRTKYCVARLTLTHHKKTVSEYDPYGSVEEYLNSPTPSGLPSNELVWGVCVPASCGARGAARLGAAMCEVTACAPHAPNVTVDHCQTAGENTEYDTGYHIFIILIGSLILTAATSTCYQCFFDQEEHPTKSLQTIITKSFCIKTNTQDLVKKNNGEIQALHGIRFLSAFMILTIHEFFYMMMFGVANMRDFKGTEGIISTLLHGDVFVDGFLAISGLLHIKGLLSNLNRPQNLFSVLWKRYMRLIGPFAVVMFYLTSMAHHAGSGPFWLQSNKVEADVCSKNWIWSLLMINTDLKTACHVVTWYISCDYQLTVLATILFYLYKKNRRIGFTAFGVAATFSLIVPAVLTYWYRLPVVFFMDIGQWYRGVHEYWQASITYTPSYSRAGAYLVGVAMGYLMTLYKPDDYRETVSKTWSTLGIAIALPTMAFISLLGKYYYLRDYEPLEVAVMAATNRVVWAVSICCVIGLCEYGTVPILSDILNWPVFTPLSKLSYGIYLIHPLVIQRKKYIQRAPITYDTYSLFLDAMGTLVASTGLSYVMWLLVEAPVINLTNQLIFNRSKQLPPSKVADQDTQDEDMTEIIKPSSIRPISRRLAAR